MQRVLLKSKIHRATVTEADLNYVGSVTIDEQLMKSADLVEFEQVHIYNITNGQRLLTYAITGAAGSGAICINGAAAHLVQPGDLVIIASYAHYDEADCRTHQAKVVLVDPDNRPLSNQGDAQNDAQNDAPPLNKP